MASLRSREGSTWQLPSPKVWIFNCIKIIKKKVQPCMVDFYGFFFLNLPSPPGWPLDPPLTKSLGAYLFDNLATINAITLRMYKYWTHYLIVYNSRRISSANRCLPKKKKKTFVLFKVFLTTAAETKPADLFSRWMRISIETKIPIFEQAIIKYFRMHRKKKFQI